MPHPRRLLQPLGGLLLAAAVLGSACQRSQRNPPSDHESQPMGNKATRPPKSCAATLAKAAGVPKALAYAAAKRYDRAAEALARAYRACRDAACRGRIRPALVGFAQCWARISETEGNLDRMVLLRRVVLKVAPGLAHRVALIRALLTTFRLGAARAELEKLGKKAPPRVRSQLKALTATLSRLTRQKTSARTRLWQRCRGLARKGMGKEALIAWSKALGMHEDRSGDLVARPDDGTMDMAIGYTSDGKQLYSGGRGGRIRVWDVQSGQVTKTITGSGRWNSNSLAIDDRGQYAASWDDQGSVSLWALPARTLVRTLKGEAGVEGVAFDPKGQYIGVWGAEMGSATLSVWALPSGKAVDFSALEDVKSVVFDPQGRFLATWSKDRAVALWALPTGKRTKTLTGHTGRVSSLQIDPQGRYLAAGSSQGVATVWELPSGKLVKTVTGHIGRVSAVAMDSGGRYLATGGLSPRGASVVKIWALPSGQLLRTYTGGTGFVRTVRFDPRGRLLAAQGEDGVVRLLAMPKGGLVRTLTARAAPLWSVALDPQGRYLAVAGVDHAIRLWALRGGTLSKTLTAHVGSVWSVAIDPQGKVLASGGQDHTVKLWALPSGRLLKTLGGHTADLRSVAFGPRGKVLASTGDDGTVKVWALPSGTLVRTLAGHQRDVNAVAVDPSGRYLVTGSSDQTVKLWSLPDGKLLQSLRGHDDFVTDLAFDAKGRQLASASWDGTVMLWTLGAGRLKRTKTLPDNPRGVNAVAFGPRGRFLASGGNDHTIKLWDLSTGKEHKSLEGHGAPLTALRFDPRGRFLVSTSGDGTTRFWDVKARKLAATVMSTAQGAWVVYTPEGYLDGSTAGRAQMRYGTGRPGGSWHLGWPRFGVPGLLDRVASGDHDYRLAELRGLLTDPAP